MQVELYSDVVCPWCYIGMTRLDQVLAEHPEVTVEYRPFLLRADVPPEGFDIPAMLKKRYGADPKQMFARVEAAAKESGLLLDLSKQPRSYSSVDAHTMIRYAGKQGRAHDVKRALFAAHFDEAKNISDHDVLAAIGVTHGLDEEAVRALLRDEDERRLTHALAGGASQLGISGVPFFVFDGRLAVSGAQPIEVLRQAIARTWQTS